MLACRISSFLCVCVYFLVQLLAFRCSACWEGPSAVFAPSLGFVCWSVRPFQVCDIGAVARCPTSWLDGEQVPVDNHTK